MSGDLIIRNIAELVTCSGFEAKSGEAMSDLKIINNGALRIEDGVITFVGSEAEWELISPDNQSDITNTIDGSGFSVLPGFVDSHTHFVFGGYRPDEFAWRLRGDSYMDIMKRGGGINSTVSSTREASKEELLESANNRLNSMLSFGVTTVEGKSGYGLDFDTEIKQLKVMKELNKSHPVDIVSTFLGAHAIPPEYLGKSDQYIGFVLDSVLPYVSENELAEFCDIFCEDHVFSVEQSRRLLNRAQTLGLGVKFHADEIVRIGGTELAAELGAVSADHLLQASDEGIRMLARNGVIATLLPGTAFGLREPYARGRFMIDQGCAVALATDLNPGSCYTESIPLIIALATLYMNLSPEEAISAMTINGAAALSRQNEVGSLDVGKLGDVVILDAPSYRYIPYHMGVNQVKTVIKRGKVVYSKNG